MKSIALTVLLAVAGLRANAQSQLKVEPKELILSLIHICNCALFHIAADVQVAVGPAVCQPVNQPRVSMKAKDDVLVFGEERIVVRIIQAMRVLAARLQLHQIDDIDYADLQIGQMLAKDGNCLLYTSRCV